MPILTEESPAYFSREKYAGREGLTVFTVVMQKNRRDGRWGWKTLYKGPCHEEASRIYLDHFRRGVPGNLVLAGPSGLLAWSPRPSVPTIGGLSDDSGI